jgi:hypothetical protein
MTMRGLVVAAALALAGSVAAEGITYRLEPIGARSLAARFDAPQLALLQALNRADLDHLARMKRIVVPDVWVSDALAYSPLPRSYAAAERHPKLLVVHQPAQVFGAYEHGQLVRWGPVSSGRKDRPTPEGVFHLNWRSEGRRSTVDPEWFMPWYFNFGNADGLSFHEYALPGRPASHACVRLLAPDARWLYGWGDGWRLDATGQHVLEAGTPVLIVGRYDFAADPPWRSPAFASTAIPLPQNPALPAAEWRELRTLPEIRLADPARLQQ